MTAPSGGERRRDDGRNHLLRLGAYLLVVGMGVWGFHSIDQEAYTRCQAVNANATSLRRLVVYATRNSNEPLPPDTPESVRELVRRGQVQAKQLRAYTDSHVTVQPCTHPWP